ncbi:hypothetical protein BGI41_03390 [Methanobrevibacter sp. 87.7]|uniref:DUF308 domain-containing protein n=1 Tax=Methanobrevibacter sp. 87.7 TaxID=387957 RepID=UPI000B50685F|nr:DUF308 domain-containing protein [Methanobrevibacter sp. 87.7]OWT33259.1 hypothetical protein BGI41_03390 [Methanobrevibacter sp. 87.7]
MNDLSITGIILFIFGIIIIIFPYLSQTFLSFVLGLIFIVYGVISLIRSYDNWNYTPGHSLTRIIGAIIGIILGVCLLGNIYLFSALVGIIFWIVGILMMIFGVAGIYYREYDPLRASSIIMLILGVITVLLGYFSFLDPFYVSLILGISLIIDGIGFISAGESAYY